MFLVEMKDDAFLPDQIIIQQGDTVKFINKGNNSHWPASNIHPTHGIYPEFDSERGIAPGESWEFQFSKPGRWRMHDHLYSKITGEVIVERKEGVAAFWNRLSTSFTDFKNKLTKTDEKYNDLITAEDTELFKNDEQLYSYVKKFGPKQTITHLNELSSEFGDCHETAHRAGRISYEIYDAEAFKNCSAECHSGCYHGATESYFKEHGTDNLASDLNLICSNELNSFFSHQCMHGIGHGLMAWSNYDLPKALTSCELLSMGEESCFTGVFMENIVGGLSEEEGHFSWYLNNDPQYPCVFVEEKFKSSCYTMQTSRMMQLFYGDFAKVAENCNKVPDAYKKTCFESMGRDVGGVSRNNPQKAIGSCMHAPQGEFRRGCLSGAVQDSFWDPSGQDVALEFCRLLTDSEEKNSCYHILFFRMSEVLPDENSQKDFCQKTEVTHREGCIDNIR